MTAFVEVLAGAPAVCLARPRAAAHSRGGHGGAVPPRLSRRRRASLPIAGSAEMLSELAGELREIEEYAAREKFEAWNPWPAFLKGVAYQEFGQWDLATEFLTKSIDMGLGMPEMYFRRAEVCLARNLPYDALADFVRGTVVLQEAVGNYHHVMHWYNDNFAEYMPPWLSPPPAFQQAAILYLVGRFQDAIDILAYHRYAEEASEDEYLWFAALSVLVGGPDSRGGVPSNDLPETGTRHALWDFLAEPSPESLLRVNEAVESLQGTSGSSRSSLLLLAVVAHAVGMTEIIEETLHKILNSKQDSVITFEAAIAQAMLSQKTWEMPRDK